MPEMKDPRAERRSASADDLVGRLVGLMIAARPRSWDALNPAAAALLDALDRWIRSGSAQDKAAVQAATNRLQAAISTTATQ